MFVFYTLLRILLATAQFLFGRKVAALERKFTAIARRTDELSHEPRVRPGNSNKPDPYAVARQAYLLGQAVERRERVEARYIAWQKWTDRFAGLANAVRNWQGRKLPYVVGVLDVVLAFALADYFGYREQLSTQALVDFFNSLVPRA